MNILICYDIATTTSDGARRLRRVAKLCQNHGQRVQYSLFEIEVTSAEWVFLRDGLLNNIAEDEDCLRFYFLDSAALKKIEHHGVREPRDLGGPLIV